MPPAFMIDSDVSAATVSRRPRPLIRQSAAAELELHLCAGAAAVHELSKLQAPAAPVEPAPALQVAMAAPGLALHPAAGSYYSVCDGTCCSPVQGILQAGVFHSISSTHRQPAQLAAAGAVACEQPSSSIGSLGSSQSSSSGDNLCSLPVPLAPPTPSTRDSCKAAPSTLAAQQGSPGGKFAFATLLTRDSYLLGVQALCRSLRAVRSRHPLLVLHTASLSAGAAAALELEGCELLEVQPYVPAGSHNYGQYKLQLYAECWTKLRLWEQERYDRLAYLDADMLVLRNIDALFDLPPGFYAAPDCSAGRCTQAERDRCPLFHPHSPHYFNAGCFVMTPSRAELALFGALLAAGAFPAGAYAEQDFLNDYYKGVWRPLPHIFNAQKGIRRHHPQLWEQHWQELAVIHYTDAKPWQTGHPENEQYRDLVALWWQAFEGRLLPGPAAPVPAIHARPSMQVLQPAEVGAEAAAEEAC